MDIDIDVALDLVVRLCSYTRIVTYKTAIYTFYLPIASGMILCGFDTDYHLQPAYHICMQLGIKFQIEDDYLGNKD